MRVFCGGCLVVGGPGYADDPDAAARIASHPAFAGWPLVVLRDEPARATRSDDELPVDHLHALRTGRRHPRRLHRVVRNHLAYRAAHLIDARMKPCYPKELSCDPATAGLVSRRWKEYFPAGGVEMGDSERGHLD